jgi:hypothetical protein
MYCAASNASDLLYLYAMGIFLPSAFLKSYTVATVLAYLS